MINIISITGINDNIIITTSIMTSIITTMVMIMVMTIDSNRKYSCHCKIWWVIPIIIGRYIGYIGG